MREEITMLPNPKPLSERLDNLNDSGEVGRAVEGWADEARDLEKASYLYRKYIMDLVHHVIVHGLEE
jgi:hypothetical protein